LAWRIVGSWSALFDTGYGRLLLVKIALAMVAVLIAAWNRWAFLPGLQRAARRRDRRAGSRVVVRATVAEASVLLAVLLVAGFLVDKSPESDLDVAASGDTAQTDVQTATLGDVTVLASLSPQTIGPNTVTVQLRDSAGAPTEFFEPPQVRLFGDPVDLGTVPVTSTVAGTYTAQVVLPSPGTWRLQVSLRTSQFDNPVATLDFTVGGARR
jgi:copper transport protein